MAARIIWKGAISFGLVHVPVALYPGSTETGIDFDWLDKRSMDPVGYKRINKRTGKEIDRTDIVKGVKLDDGDYVVLSDDEIKAAYPKTTQTIEIEAFVKAADIPFVFLERPYYLEPIAKGEKVYALLREAMLQQGVIGIGRVVMHTKEHLAALIPSGAALILNTLRWQNEIRPSNELNIPGEGKSAANLKDGELKMAAQLVADMTAAWKPEQYSDRFAEAVHALVKQRAEAGKTEKVQSLESGADAAPANNVLDLTELLRKSLGSRKAAESSALNSPAAAPAASPVSAASKPVAATKSTAKVPAKTAPRKRA